MNDYTGQKYGYLTVIQFVGKIKKVNRNEYIWKFKCICGKEKNINIHEVRMGRTSSCGCLRSKLQSDSKRKPPGVAAMNNLYNIYMKTCVEERGYKFELTKEEFFILTKSNCYYCNKEPSQVKKAKYSNYVYNGIDRVDNSEGYLRNNVVACCKECNSNKSGISRELIIKVYNFLKEKGKI